MCPVCRARFRGATACSRCGADLTVVMTLAALAWRMRVAAREALAAGELARARELAAGAQEICYTQVGRRLAAVGEWLEGSAGWESRPHFTDGCVIRQVTSVCPTAE